MHLGGVCGHINICVGEKEREQDHSSSLPQFLLIPFPPFAVTSHVEDDVLHFD